MKYAKELNFPRIPEELIQEVYDSLKNPCAYITSGASIDNKNWQYDFYEPTNALNQWLVDNIQPRGPWRGFAVQTLTGDVPAHTDWPHEATKLLYLVELGGQDIHTSWYQTKQEDFLKPATNAGGAVVDPSLCTEDNLLFRAQFETHKWYELKVNVLHYVDNIETTRISVATFDSIYIRK